MELTNSFCCLELDVSLVLGSWCLVLSPQATVLSPQRPPSHINHLWRRRFLALAAASLQITHRSRSARKGQGNAGAFSRAAFDAQFTAVLANDTPHDEHAETHTRLSRRKPGIVH